MKLTESGEIEACCAFSRNLDWTIDRDVDQTLFITAEEIGIQIICMPLRQFNFCPNCGAKTEIEGEEKL